MRASVSRLFSASLILLLIGCQRFEPVGDYTGSCTVTTQTRTHTNSAADDAANVSSWRGHESRSGVRARVARVDESHLTVTLLGCDLQLTQEPEPNQHNAQVEPGQRCRFAINDRQEEIGLAGNALFGRDDRSLSLTLDGDARREANGLPDGFYASWSLTFDGD